jgi:hypothetical protein
MQLCQEGTQKQPLEREMQRVKGSACAAKQRAQ